MNSIKKSLKIILNMIKIEKNPKTNSYRLNFYSDPFVDFLIGIGLVGHSKDKRVPKDIMNGTKEEIIGFMAGFYDAEGNSLALLDFSSSKDLLKDVQMML